MAVSAAGLTHAAADLVAGIIAGTRLNAGSEGITLGVVEGAAEGRVVDGRHKAEGEIQG